MQDGNLTFDEALKEAQVHGYAEADPAADVDGYDTRNKLVILSRLAYGIFLDRDKIPVDGIRNVSKLDMSYAKQLGYTIKLLGVSRPTLDEKIEAKVCPCFVSLQHPLASVRGIENGLQVYDELRGVQTIVAAGAGANPTAAAILRDLLALSKQEPIVWTAPSREHLTFKYAKPYSTVRKFYVRMNAENKPGVLAGISKVFAKNGINITSVLQDDASALDVVPVVIMCGPTEERNIIKALKEIEASHAVSSPSQFIRVEDTLHEVDCAECSFL
jgi:homoserine dehydrogenase